MCTKCKKNTVLWLSFDFVQIVNFAFTRVALLSFGRRISRQQCVTRGKKGQKCTCTNTCPYSTRLISIYLPSILVSGGVTQEIFTVVAKRLDSSLRRDVLRIQVWIIRTELCPFWKPLSLSMFAIDLRTVAHIGLFMHAVILYLV